MQILIVEDETKVAGFIRQALEEEGHVVDLASDGGAGFRMAMTVDYDVIILDLLLPERDGIEVCRDLRSSGRRMPILMLTARGALQDKVTGLDTGADDYLTKPFAVAELLARVRALLRRGGISELPVFKVEDLELSTATHMAKRGGRSISLSAREYSLLEYLMRNAGRVVSREMILEHVWGYDFEGGQNVVDVYINYLRNKIDRNARVKLIRTIRGFGFRIGSDNGQ